MTFAAGTNSSNTQQQSVVSECMIVNVRRRSPAPIYPTVYCMPIREHSGTTLETLVVIVVPAAVLFLGSTRPTIAPATTGDSTSLLEDHEKPRKSSSHLAKMAHLDGIIATDSDRNGSLTLGIELEFLVPGLKPGRQDTNPLDARPLFHIEDYDHYEYPDYLNEFILPTLQDIKGIKVREETQDKFIQPHDNVPRYNVWRLINDISAKPGDDLKYSPYEWVGKEVTSEILMANNPEYEEKIKDMCHAIRNCRVHLNTSTGVHVHIGRGDNGLTLRTVKRIATLIWLVDTQLLSLQHPSRWDNKHCQSLRKMSKLAHCTDPSPGCSGFDLAETEPENATELRDNIPNDLPDFLMTKISKVWATKDLESLAHLMSNTNDANARNPMRSAIRGTVGFRRFLPAGKTGGNINTVEFRQMAGSLDPNHISRWIRVCVHLMDFARLSNNKDFCSLVAKAARNGPRYSALDLLRDIGLDSEIDF